MKKGNISNHEKLRKKIKLQYNFFEQYIEELIIEKILSNRSFGLIFAGTFFIIGVIKNGYEFSKNTSWLSISLLFLLTAFIVPRVLHPLNCFWMKFTQLLNKIMALFIMGIIFFCIITPFGFIGKLFGWDPLKLKFNKNLKSYWIDKALSKTGTLHNQF